MICLINWVPSFRLFSRWTFQIVRALQLLTVKSHHLRQIKLIRRRVSKYAVKLAHLESTLQNRDRYVADRTSDGRSFQMIGTWTVKALEANRVLVVGSTNTALLEDHSPWWYAGWRSVPRDRQPVGDEPWTSSSRSCKRFFHVVSEASVADRRRPFVGDTYGAKTDGNMWCYWILTFLNLFRQYGK